MQMHRPPNTLPPESVHVCGRFGVRTGPNMGIGHWVPQLGSEQANRLSPTEYLSRIGRTADGEHKALLQLDFNGAPAR